MSVHWMSWVWQFGPLDPQQRYVLLKLADNANQDGKCWPSLSNISLTTRLSESTVRRCVTSLEKGGWLEVNRGLGRNNNSQYTLVEKVSGCNPLPEKVSERKVSHRPIKGVTVTAPLHPLKEEPSRTPKEKVPDSLPEWLDPILWTGWVDMRKRMRNAPFTDLARKSILADLAKLKNYGKDPNDRLQEGIKRGWRGVLFDSDKPLNGAVHKPVVDWIDPATNKPMFEGKTH